MLPILVLVVAIGISGLLISVKPPAEKKEERTIKTSLYVDQVRRETVQLTVNTQGAVTPKTMVNVIPEVSGRIIKVSDAFLEGASFEPGQILIEIDPSNYKLAVTRAEARVAEAAVKLEQELADAHIKAKQWQDWVHDGAPTPLALNKPQVAEAQAKLRAAEADMEEAKLNLERTRIRMPFAGRVIERQIGVGQFVNAGTQLGSVFSTDAVEIRLPLTDKQLAEINLPIGFVATDETAPKVDLSAFVGGVQHHWNGSIRRISASVDSQTRLVFAIAEVKDPYGQGRSQNMPIAVGLFVSAAIEGARAQDTLVIPRDALRSNNRVFVINGDNELEIRNVDVLASDAGRAIISTGLMSGENVVTSPVRAATPGMKVTPLTRSVNASQETGNNTTVAAAQ